MIRNKLGRFVKGHIKPKEWFYWKGKEFSKGHIKHLRENSDAIKRIGSKHPLWKGGYIKLKNGYIAVKVSKKSPFFCMTRSDGYVLEHRYLVAKKLNRPLEKWEIVHHLNGVRDDNREKNLELLTAPIHKLVTRMEVIIKELKTENQELRKKLEIPLKRLDNRK